LEKFKEENYLLKSKTKDNENRLKYMQNNLSNLNKKTACRVLSARLLEVNAYLKWKKYLFFD